MRRVGFGLSPTSIVGRLGTRCHRLAPKKLKGDHLHAIDSYIHTSNAQFSLVFFLAVGLFTLFWLDSLNSTRSASANERTRTRQFNSQHQPISLYTTNGTYHRFIVSYSIPSHVSMRLFFSDCGWFDDLTHEGIEPNPGPCSVQVGAASASQSCFCQLTKQDLEAGGISLVDGTCRVCNHQTHMHSESMVAPSYTPAGPPHHTHARTVACEGSRSETSGAMHVHDRRKYKACTAIIRLLSLSLSLSLFLSLFDFSLSSISLFDLSHQSRFCT